MSMAVTCDCVGASTRGYSAFVLESYLAGAAEMSLGVRLRAAPAVAPAMATLFRGGVNGPRVLLQVESPATADPATLSGTAVGFPERNRPRASGATRGGKQPGVRSSGAAKLPPAAFASCAGHASDWPLYTTPADWTPMVMPVPIDTKRVKASRPLGPLSCASRFSQDEASTASRATTAARRAGAI